MTEWADFLRQYGAVIGGVCGALLIAGVWAGREISRDMNE